MINIAKQNRGTIIHLLIITVVGFIIYSNTLHFSFHFDDTSNIVENYTLRNLNNLWPPSGSRWFGFLTFALNYHVGGLDPFGYHIFNISIHIINAILVYYLVALTFKTTFFTSQKSAKLLTPDSPIHRFTDSPSVIALFSALIFVAHPIQTQAVTYIVQRFTSLAAFFYLLSLIMYVKARISTLHAARYTIYAISLFSAILAMKTKEISFTLPFIIALYEFSFFTGSPNFEPSPWRVAEGDRTSNFKRLSYLAPFLLTLLIIPLSMVGMNRPLGETIGELRDSTAETTVIGRWSYLFTQFRVIVTYIRLLIFPVNQNVDYDYPIYHSFFEPSVFLSFLFLLLIFAFAVYLFYATRYTLYATRLISFGIFWFFITLSVESSIIPIRDVIFEHRLYLPGVGAIMVFVSSIFYVLHIIGRRLKSWDLPGRSGYSMHIPLTAVYLLLTTAIVLILSVAAYERNKVWQDEISLWRDVVRKSPLKARGYANLGTAYGKTGATDEAIKCFKIDLTLMPDDAEIHSDIGSAYGEKGWTDMAVEHLQTALRLRPDLAKAHNNLGVVYSSKRMIDKSIEHLQTAIRLKPALAEAHNNLGNAYYKKGLLDDAIREYQIALSLKPDDADARYNLALVYAMKKAINSNRR